MFYFYVLAIFWFIRTTKSLLFWLYLWQLKEYHLGRFLDHFQTEKGKGLLLNKLLFLKIVLVLFLFYYFFLFPFEIRIFAILLFPVLLALLYFGEICFIFKNLFHRRLKGPVLTKKTAVLISTGLIVQILFLYFLFQDIGIYYLERFAFGLLVFDILTPVIVSAIVLFSQPLTVLLRNQIIKKAERKRREFKNLLVIGITGSYGKTSTKEFLAAILAERFKTLKTKENQNSEMGISQCILQELKPEHEIFICEMGAYNRGGIKLLCDIVKPKIGIITGVNEQHLATFGSMENLLSAEGGKEMIDSLPKDGVVFFNAKNKYCQELYQKTGIKKFLYGQEAKFPGGENIEGVRVVARELGMNEEEISRAVEKIENKWPGIKIKKRANGLNIIDASYSANPTGVMAHLDYLKTWPGRKIIIMPCLIELGSASKRVHQEIGKKIGEVCDLAIIITKDRFKEIKQGAPGALFIENPKEILEKIKNFCKKGDIILLEGRVPKQLINWYG